VGSIQINFAEVGSDFETIPEGSYPIVVDKAEVRESKSSDNPYINWEMTITEGEHEGRRLWMITSLSPKALFRLKDVFEALGVLEDEMEVEWDEDVAITPEAGPLLVNPDVSGAVAMALVTIDYDYDPKGRNKVDALTEITDDPRAVATGGTQRPTPSSKNSAKKAAPRRALR
jgi:hypothetical protein